jgi:hypothetical protein
MIFKNRKKRKKKKEDKINLPVCFSVVEGHLTRHNVASNASKNIMHDLAMSIPLFKNAYCRFFT